MYDAATGPPVATISQMGPNRQIASTQSVDIAKITPTRLVGGIYQNRVASIGAQNHTDIVGENRSKPIPPYLLKTCYYEYPDFANPILRHSKCPSGIDSLFGIHSLTARGLLFTRRSTIYGATSSHSHKNIVAFVYIESEGDWGFLRAPFPSRSSTNKEKTTRIRRIAKSEGSPIK